MKLLISPGHGTGKIESEAAGTCREQGGFSFPPAKLPHDVPLILLLHFSMVPWRAVLLSSLCSVTSCPEKDTQRGQSGGESRDLCVPHPIQLGTITGRGCWRKKRPESKRSQALDGQTSVQTLPWCLKHSMLLQCLSSPDDAN